MATVKDGEHMSVSVRKIDNGYIVSHTKSGADGYECREVYHSEKPKPDVPALRAAAHPRKRPRST